jgi:hypothetical protein
MEENTMKMNKPELSVVRFSEEDVIVTSGVSKVGLLLPKKAEYVDYAFLTTEAQEAGLTFMGEGSNQIYSVIV